MPTSPEDRYITLGHRRARYWKRGEHGPAVILLHGLGASAEMWQHNIDALARNHQVFVPDFPGFGRSERPPASFTPRDYIAFLNDFLHALDIHEPSLVGQSMGGGIALQYTIDFPEKVRKLVLVDCAGFGKEVIWTLRLMTLPLLGEIISYPTRLSVELFFKIAVNNKEVITREFVDTYYELFSQPGFQGFLLKITRMLVDLHGPREEFVLPVMENLHKIKNQTLIIWGDKDMVFPLRHARYGTNRIPHSRLYVMKGCGHVPNLERPGEFNEAVLEFLGTK